MSWLSQHTQKPYRLPSEAEWEYAARAGAAPYVGTYPANAWGLYDMHGKVLEWEWVEDVWHGSYKGAPTDGTAWVDGEEQSSSSGRVVRGGSWYISPRDLRSTGRDRNEPGYRSSKLAFRIARTLTP